MGWPEPGSERQVKETLDFRLGFIDFARVHLSLPCTAVVLVTCLNQCVKRRQLHPSCGDLYADAHHDDGCEDHQPPLVRGRRVKLKYAHAVVITRRLW